MFSNKHVVIALLVAPVLAIITWFAVGSFVGEKPQQAQPGQSYPLVERSNCRYDSGQCDLRNEDMRLSITLEGEAPLASLVLVSNQALDGALLAVAANIDAVPRPMQRADQTGQRWLLPINGVPHRQERLRVVVQSGGSNWFAEASTEFLETYRVAGSSD